MKEAEQIMKSYCGSCFSEGMGGSPIIWEHDLPDEEEFFSMLNTTSSMLILMKHEDGAPFTNWCFPDDSYIQLYENSLSFGDDYRKAIDFYYDK